MNNRGFTLVELLATIVLLGVITAISYVSINAVINKNKKNNCEILKNNITSAVKMYVSDNRYKSLNITNNKLTISISVLTEDEYLTGYSGNGDIQIDVELNSDNTVKSVTVPDSVCE